VDVKQIGRELGVRYVLEGSVRRAGKRLRITGQLIDASLWTSQSEAVRLAHLALSIDDGDPETLARASTVSAHLVGDSEAEIEMADRAVALNPNSWITWNCRGHVFRIAGLPEEAIRSHEGAIRMSPVDPRLHMTLTGIGQALIELRR
jgi:adenylate cyclase